jgi:phage tail-like protein
MSTIPSSQEVSANGAAPPPARVRWYLPEWPSPPPGVPVGRSSYLDLLPGIYHESEFLGRFLLIFEHILGPVDRTVANIPEYFDAGVAPPEFVPWLASWLGIALDARWPVERQRDVIREAPELFRWRGTRRGLSRFLELYLGSPPEIDQPTLREIAADRTRAFRFTVRVRAARAAGLSRPLVESIIELEKPAFAACSLEWIET